MLFRATFSVFKMYTANILTHQEQPVATVNSERYLFQLDVLKSMRNRIATQLNAYHIESRKNAQHTLTYSQGGERERN